MTEKEYVWKKIVTKKLLFYFLVQGSDGGGTFHLLFCNLHKIWI
jgi:hypothetical protein